MTQEKVASVFYIAMILIDLLLNPLIYGFRNKDVNHVLRKVMGKKCIALQDSSPGHSGFFFFFLSLKLNFFSLF